LQKAKAYTGISPLAKALLSADRPRWEFLAAVSIDQRAASSQAAALQRVGVAHTRQRV